MQNSSGPLDPPGRGLAPSLPASELPEARPSLRKNSLARLAADLLGIALALVAATVAARVLGLAGKGYYSSLVLLGGIFIQVFGAGLGEAAIVLAGRGHATLAAAVAGTMAAVVPLSLAAGLLFWLTATAALGRDEPPKGSAVVLASLLVVLTINYSTMVTFLVARERVVAVAMLSIASNGVATVALWILLAVQDRGVDGAILGALIGVTIGLWGTGWVLRGASISLRPSLARGYLGTAFRLGVALQVSNLLVLLTARLDLILVFRLSGPVTAGAYSVALTIGALVGSAPIAVSYASFPRLASLDDREARLLTLQVFRVGMAAAISAGVVLSLASPFAIPLAFGEEYRPAIVPTIILLPGGILWSGQWLLCRAAAARGTPRPLLVSFALSFVTMISLDVALIGSAGAVGAAAAAAIASLLGLLVALGYYRKAGWDLRGFVPGPGDFRDFMATALAMVTRRRAVAGGAPLG